MHTAVFDLESDGLLDQLTKIHCLHIKDFETNEVFRFDKERVTNALDILANAEYVVGHNIVGFDIPAIEKVFPQFELSGRIRDTLIYSQVMFSNQKEKDFPAFHAGKLPGEFIGSHTLAAWGYRLKNFKGDYAKEMRAEALSKGIVDEVEISKYVWARWSKSLSDYCVQDIEVTAELWYKIQQELTEANERAILTEHRVHDTFALMQRDGFPVNVPEVEKLADELQEEMDAFRNKTVKHFGSWHAPKKKIELYPAWINDNTDDVKTFLKVTKRPPPGSDRPAFREGCALIEPLPNVNPMKRTEFTSAMSDWWEDRSFYEKKAVMDLARKCRMVSASEKLASDNYKTPRPSYYEDASRRWWGEVQVSKTDRNAKKHSSVDKNGKTRFYFSTTKGALSCPIVRKDFNPASRVQIADRFITIYNWMPKDFTDKGSPKIDDDILTAMPIKDPTGKKIAEWLGEYFYYSKRYSQIAGGDKAWLTNVDEDGVSHCRTNAGGTVTGRSAHSNFNIGQVPAITLGKMVDGKATHKGKILKKDQYELTKHGAVLVKGRPGSHGYECRAAFGPPEGFVQVGTDLSGIEFRCLAERCREFDGGALIDVVLHGDIHTENWNNSGVETRDIAKRSLYALMYGAGDWKLGHTAYPEARDEEKRALGADIRAKLMKGLPALKKVILKIQRQAQRGYIDGLDGRSLFVRSPHSALNTALQSDGAIIAKRWTLISVDLMADEGYDVGLEYGHWSLMAHVHDEMQAAARERLAKLLADVFEQAALDTGKFFGFACPIEAESKIGHSWKDTH